MVFLSSNSNVIEVIMIKHNINDSNNSNNNNNNRIHNCNNNHMNTNHNNNKSTMNITIIICMRILIYMLYSIYILAILRFIHFTLMYIHMYPYCYCSLLLGRFQSSVHTGSNLLCTYNRSGCTREWTHDRL